jgi:hypothetical protein
MSGIIALLSTACRSPVARLTASMRHWPPFD